MKNLLFTLALLSAAIPAAAQQNAATPEGHLPVAAPAEWQNREILWNAVEENEKTKDSRPF